MKGEATLRKLTPYLCPWCSKPNQGPANKAWQRPSWFPSTTVSDILTRRAWNTLHVMTLEQSHALKQAFNTAADETGYVSWIKSMQIAKDLNLEYEQVWHQTGAAGNCCCVHGIPLMTPVVTHTELVLFRVLMTIPMMLVPLFSLCPSQPLPTCIVLCCLCQW